MSGQDVRDLQGLLTRAGFPTSVAGVFGPSTERTVKAFERTYHLKRNGIVDATFVRELQRVAAAHSTTAAADSSKSGAKGTPTSTGGTGIPGASSSTTTSTHKTASHKASKTVKRTPKNTTIKPTGGSQHLGQRVLREGMSGHDVRVLQGFLTLAGFFTGVDGQFGPMTKQNVIAFQRAHSMTPNGVVSFAVAQALRRAVSAQYVGGPVTKAHINADGTATAPSNAPAVVKAVIASANKIIDKPYIYGGGHGQWNDSGYDCSGAVSYALHGANLLSAPEDSTELESYGSPGPGHWITIYADSGHTWIVVAGIAFDTADFGGPNIPSGDGPRWRSDPTGNLADGGNYVVRHPSGL